MNFPPDGSANKLHTCSQGSESYELKNVAMITPGLYVGSKSTVLLVISLRIIMSLIESRIIVTLSGSLMKGFIGVTLLKKKNKQKQSRKVLGKALKSSTSQYHTKAFIV